LTNHHRNLLAAKHLLVDGPLAQCQPKIVCDPLVVLKGDSYRLKGRDLGRMAPTDEPI
jgi:hypothetical protein